MTLTLLQTVGLVGFVGMKWPPYMQSLVGFVFRLTDRAGRVQEPGEYGKVLGEVQLHKKS